jgi:SAM-dependent methyltransferase
VYDKVLASVHDLGFGDIARAVFEEIARLHPDLREKRITDLGCGSGILLELACNAGARCNGVDVSREMVAIARERAPDAVLTTADLFSAPIDTSHLIIMVGEILSYAAIDRTHEEIKRLIERIYDKLVSEGEFIFDVLGGDFDFERTSMHETEGFTVFSKVSDRDGIVCRDITTFLKAGEGYIKSKELHRLRKFDSEQIEKILVEAGFHIRRLGKYGSMDILPGRLAYMCTKQVAC